MQYKLKKSIKHVKTLLTLISRIAFRSNGMNLIDSKTEFIRDHLHISRKETLNRIKSNDELSV